MVANQEFCEVDTWDISDLVDACKPQPSGKRRISIPEFQRRLVWSKEKQAKLIASIKKGYPVGALLLYEDRPFNTGNDINKRNYKLIDGLQRTQALREYVSKPTQFFNRDDVTDDVIRAIRQTFSLYYDFDEEKIISTIIQWVRNLDGFTEIDGWGVDGLIGKLINELPFDNESDEFNRAYVKVSRDELLKRALASFLKMIRENSDISKAKLPIIIFNGSTSELPTVFELLNSQGIALSRYEIFAAQWINERQIIKNNKIIAAIWRKYDALEDEGFTLDVSEVAPDNRTRQNREYTLFEYLFGLGQFLSDKYPHLFKSVSADRPSSAGFNLVSACIGLNVKDMEKLPNHLISINRDKFEANILTSINFVSDVLNPILSVKRKSKSQSIYHTEYQIVSMIATAFQVRYDHSSDFEEKGGWRSQWGNLKQYLPMFYLYDILRDYWKGSGDTKLFDVVSNYRYTRPSPSKDSWNQVLENWFLDKQATLSHSRRNVRDATPEILFLKYIYVHTLSIAENSKRYHVEHIIPIDQLTAEMKKGEKWQLNAVSNLALLRASDNVKKGNKTFKQYLDDRLDDDQIDESEYAMKISEMEKQLICPVTMLPTTITKESFEGFILDRFDYLKEAFYEVWQECIPSDKVT